MIMSLIEKALRQLERDKQKAGFSAYPGAPPPSAAAEEFYEKADDAAGGHVGEDRGALRSWKRGVTAGAALVLAISAAALWYLQPGGEKAAEQAAPISLLTTIPVAAAPRSAGVPTAAAVFPQQEQKDASRDGSGRFSRQQPAVSTAQPQAPKPSDPHAVQDDAGSPEVKRLLPAATHPRPPPAPTQSARRGQTHHSAAAAGQPGSDLKAPRSAVSEGAANLLQRDSEDADSLNTRGVQLLEQGASAQAGDYFAQALKRSPDDEKALNNMGLSLYARGRTAEALTYYERAVKVNPDTIETYVNMGIALRSRKDYTRAAAVFQKALALNPSHPETLYNYGLLLKDMGQQDKTRICFEQFLKTAPPHLQGVADSVRAYLQTSAVTQQ
jgi:tetratricopeptide (TPR) repeat protein